MQAIRYQHFGSPDCLEYVDLPQPQPSKGEVLVKLHFSAVHPSDVKKRAGANPKLLENGFVIPHSDGSGVVVGVGAEVEQTRIGERVWIYQAQHKRAHGTCAQYLCINSARAPALPTHASFEHGAQLGIPFMTAHRCVHADGVPNGQTLLITGGASRVGHAAIQLAKMAQAQVIATASSDEDVAACLDVGADHIINHRAANTAEQLGQALDGRALHRVIDLDFGTNHVWYLPHVSTGAVIATYGSMSQPKPSIPFYDFMYRDLCVRFVIVYDMPEGAKKQAIADLNQAISNASLKFRIPQVFPLAQTSTAHQAVEQSSTRGAVLVQIS